MDRVAAKLILTMVLPALLYYPAISALAINTGLHNEQVNLASLLGPAFSTVVSNNLAPSYPATQTRGAFGPQPYFPAPNYSAQAMFPGIRAAGQYPYQQLLQPSANSQAYNAYIAQYGTAPKDPGDANQKSPSAGTATTESTPTTTDTDEKDEAEASTVSPEVVFALRKLIATQQNDLMHLQEQVSTLISQLQSEQQRVTKEKAAAASRGSSSGLHVDIQFPKKDVINGGSKKNNEVTKQGSSTKTEAGATPSDSSAEAQENASSEASSDDKGVNKDKEGKLAKELKVSQPIPLLVMKPDAVEDIQDVIELAKQEHEAETAAEEIEVKDPSEVHALSAEERINSSVSKINQMEARKAEIETELHMRDNKLVAGNAAARSSLGFQALHPLPVGYPGAAVLPQNQVTGFQPLPRPIVP